MEPPRVQVGISPIIYLRIRSMYDGILLPGLKAVYIPDNDPIDFPSIMLLVLASGASLDVVELNHRAISERNFFIPFLSSLVVPQLGHLALRGTENI